MKCPHCGITVGCRSKVCPLCHVPFNNVDGTLDSASKLPRAFPKRGKAPFLSNTAFDKIYLLVCLIIIALSFLIENLVFHKNTVSLFISGVLLYIYFFIRCTIMDTNFFPAKILAQIVVLSVVFLLAQRMFLPKLFIIEIVLPITYIIATLSIAFYMISRRKHPQLFFLNLLIVAIINLLPLAIVHFVREASIVLPIISASVGLLTLLFEIVFCSKQIKQEFVRIFHN